MEKSRATYQIGDDVYEVVKPKRLRDGQVLKSGDKYARLGPKSFVLEEQIHTTNLFERGFPAPKVIESGPYGEDEWYFIEQSLGDQTFHDMFKTETQENGKVSDSTFQDYLSVMSKYLDAQVSAKNHSNIKPAEFINALLFEDVLPNYCYFGFDAEPYQAAINKVTKRLDGVPTGIMQYDLNPYNVLKGGIIDFELVGYGPIAYDVLMSVRWGGSWFTQYPSRYPVAYSLSKEQISENDNLVSSKTTLAGLLNPVDFLEEFLVLKSAWAVMEHDVPRQDMPQDKIAFRRFRATLLDRSVNQYLSGEPIDYWNFASLPGREIDH